MPSFEKNAAVKLRDCVQNKYVCARFACRIKGLSTYVVDVCSERPREPDGPLGPLGPLRPLKSRWVLLTPFREMGPAVKGGFGRLLDREVSLGSLWLTKAPTVFQALVDVRQRVSVGVVHVHIERSPLTCGPICAFPNHAIPIFAPPPASLSPLRAMST